MKKVLKARKIGEKKTNHVIALFLRNNASVVLDDETGESLPIVVSEHEFFTDEAGVISEPFKLDVDEIMKNI